MLMEAGWPAGRGGFRRGSKLRGYLISPSLFPPFLAESEWANSITESTNKGDNNGRARRESFLLLSFGELWFSLSLSLSQGCQLCRIWHKNKIG